MIVAIAVTAVCYILLKPCEFCGDKLCFGKCTIVYDAQGNPIKKQDDAAPLSHKTNQKSTRISETDLADVSYLDSLTFVGDSRTIGLKAFAKLKDENVFAEDGLNHEAALTKKVVQLQQFQSVSIPEAVRVTAPDIMVVNFGINGIVWLGLEAFIEGYEKLIDELILSSPSSVIVIEAIMPVSMKYENGADGVTNEKIDDANLLLYELAKEKGLYYLATDEVLKNEYNDLDDTLHNGDGLHYNKAAYDIIIDYILRHQIYRK